MASASNCRPPPAQPPEPRCRRVADSFGPVYTTVFEIRFKAAATMTIEGCQSHAETGRRAAVLRGDPLGMLVDHGIARSTPARPGAAAAAGRQANPRQQHRRAFFPERQSEKRCDQRSAKV